MFIITQLIGLYVINFYLANSAQIPYGFGQSQLPQATNSIDMVLLLINVAISLIIAIALIFLLIKIKSGLIFRGWFFIVVSIALGITLTTITAQLNIPFAAYIALAAGVVLAYLKFFRGNVILHNLTELLIYPGIAIIFTGIFNLTAVIILLLIISVYDVWAVWRSGIMQKMAKFQIKTLGMLGGFMIPYASKATKQKIQLLRMKFKGRKIPEKIIKKNKLRIGLAILGGGDIVFPIIAAGVFLKASQSLSATLIVIGFASLALLGLLLFGKKKKPYPAMPYLTAGILIGMIVGWLLI